MNFPIQKEVKEVNTPQVILMCIRVENLWAG